MFKALCLLCLPQKTRTEIYYCHPYSFYERESNEQMNGQIRKFIPKGTDISKVSKERVREITSHFNTYLKRSLEGKTSEQLFPQERAKMGIAILFFLPPWGKKRALKIRHGVLH